MLKFEDPNNGPRRLLPGDEQDLGEDLRIELDRLVFSILPTRSPKNAPGPRFKRLRRVHRSMSRFVTSRPATTRQRFSMVALAARVRGHGASSGRPVLCEVACWRCRIPNIVALGQSRFAS
jgi:hypothetical protein